MSLTINQITALDNNGSWMSKCFNTRAQFMDGTLILYRVLILIVTIIAAKKIKAFKLRITQILNLRIRICFIIRI